MNTLINSILVSSQVVTQQILVALKNVLGFDVDIFYPIRKETIYLGEDIKITYAPEPDVSDRFIVVGLFEYATHVRDNSFDPFLPSVKIYFDNDKTVAPDRSKLIVYLGSNFYRFRLEKTEAIGGVGGSLISVGRLTPYI